MISRKTALVSSTQNGISRTSGNISASVNFDIRNIAPPIVRRNWTGIGTENGIKATSEEVPAMITHERRVARIDRNRNTTT